MQPAKANARACTGDGPATPALSSTIDAVPLVPENCRSPTHFRSTMVGGFADTGAIVSFGEAPAKRRLRPRCYEWTTDCGGTAAVSDSARGAFGTSTGRFENTALIISQPSGRITSRYDSRWPNGLSGPHDS